MTNEDMPSMIWVYNREGTLEARDCNIVVGNKEYVQRELLDAALECLRWYGEISESTYEARTTIESIESKLRG